MPYLQNLIMGKKLPNIIELSLKFHLNFTLIKNNSYINMYNIFIKKKYIKNIFYYLNYNKKNTLIDLYAIDNNLNLFNIQKCKYIFTLMYFKESFLNIITSSNNIFFSNKFNKNASFLQRELSEFFNIYIYNSNDNRILLNDYNNKKYYLLKNYNIVLNFSKNKKDLINNLILKKNEI